MLVRLTQLLCCTPHSPCVTYVYCPHSILDGGDYVAINQTVTFEIEDVEKEIQTTILDNSAVERVEQFTVFLTPLVGVFPVAVQDSLAVVSITDNDGR